ncbi:MAG: quinol:cytochrome C oxidoreductase, partial [Flavitalea sp.]
MASKEYFEVPKRYKNWSYGLMGIGVLALIVGFLMYGTGDDELRTRFWGALLQNSIYFLLIINACMFFICASTLAHSGWHVAFQRIPEAISA